MEIEKIPIKEVLVVDDEEETRKLLKFYLEKEGFSVLEASSGEEAEKIAILQNPSLIVMDIVMPSSDGITTIIKLKENPNTKEIPIICISGKEGFKDFLELNPEIDVADFFPKPFKAEDIIERIKELI